MLLKEKAKNLVANNQSGFYLLTMEVFPYFAFLYVISILCESGHLLVAFIQGAAAFSWFLLHNEKVDLERSLSRSENECRKNKEVINEYRAKYNLALNILTEDQKRVFYDEKFKLEEKIFREQSNH